MSVRARKEVIVSGGTFNTPQILKLSGVGPAEELNKFNIPVVVDLPAVGNFMQDNYESGVHIIAEQPWMTPQPPSPSTPNCTRTYDDSDPCFVLWERNATGPYVAQIGSAYTGRSSVSWDSDGDLCFLSQPTRQSSGFFPGYSNNTPNPYHYTTAVRIITILDSAKRPERFSRRGRRVQPLPGQILPMTKFPREYVADLVYVEFRLSRCRQPIQLVLSN